MKRTKRKLRKWVKNTLVIIAIIIFVIIIGLIINIGMNNFNELARQCDEAKGYTCSYYEVRQYGLGINYENK